MTIEQEDIAEGIINRMKKEKGSTDWNKYLTDNSNINKKDMLLVIEGLKDKDIITKHIPAEESIRLTDSGWAFPGFEAERHIIELQKEDEVINREKLKIELMIAKRTYKVFWLAFGLSIAAFIISVITLIVK